MNEKTQKRETERSGWVNNFGTLFCYDYKDDDGENVPHLGSQSV